jgi:uncharacterized membrane protein
LLLSVLANIWIRVINNFTFKYLNLNQDSFWWALLIAIVLTGIFVSYIFLAFDEDNGNALKTRIVGLNFAGSTVTNITNISPETNHISNDVINNDTSNNDTSNNDTSNN